MPPIINNIEGIDSTDTPSKTHGIISLERNSRQQHYYGKIALIEILYTCAWQYSIIIIYKILGWLRKNKITCIISSDRQSYVYLKCLIVKYVTSKFEFKIHWLTSPHSEWLNNQNSLTHAYPFCDVLFVYFRKRHFHGTCLSPIISESFSLWFLFLFFE